MNKPKAEDVTTKPSDVAVIEANDSELRSRIGIFYMSRQLVEIECHRTARFFSEIGFVPLRVECLGGMEKYEYFGYCALFEPVPEGMECYVYEFRTTETDGITALKSDELRYGQ